MLLLCLAVASQRIFLRANGAPVGFVTRKPKDFPTLAKLATGLLSMDLPVTRLFISTGDELSPDSFDLIGTDDVVFASSGDPFMPPALSAPPTAATRSRTAATRADPTRPEPNHTEPYPNHTHLAQPHKANSTAARLLNMRCSDEMGNVQWWLQNSSGGKPPIVSFEWPAETQLRCGFRHFGEKKDTSDLLRGQRLAFLGNSVFRRLMLTIMHLVLRSQTLPLTGAMLGAHNLPSTAPSLQDHGASHYELNESGLLGHASCTNMNISQCCSSTYGLKRNTTQLHYQYTASPSERAIGRLLNNWLALEEATKIPAQPCSLQDASVVVLQCTTSSSKSTWEKIIHTIIKLRSVLHSKKTQAPIFLIMDRTEVSHPTGWQDWPDPLGLQAPTVLYSLVQFEHWLLDYTKHTRGVAVVPVSIGTSHGIAQKVLKHPNGSSWHFNDPGRIYIAQILLNCLQRAQLEGIHQAYTKG